MGPTIYFLSITRRLVFSYNVSDTAALCTVHSKNQALKFKRKSNTRMEPYFHSSAVSMYLFLCDSHCLALITVTAVAIY